ncbi:carbohydrate kinase family protein [Luteolibacter soli]|uniref:PfkB family carbohydrate kinase n=1 Tax=Luteolibacter soli TaxID=3135280 RepID=A0ABU9AQK4_9BACT
MPESSIEVIAAGINTVDFLARPPDGVVVGGKYETDELDVQGGGPASTAACITAAFGHATAFIARLGDDPVSLLSRSQFAAAGIRPDFIIHAPGERVAMSLVQIDRTTGERTVYYNLRNYGWLHPEDIPADAIRKARLIFVDGYDAPAALGMLRATHGSDCRSIIDLEHGDTAFLHECISLATDVLLPLHTARAATGKESPADCLAALADLGSGQMIVTDGERGSWALTAEGILHQPCFPVEVVDTNGCGDAFHGGYGVGLLRGWPLPLRLEFGAWVASRVATALGGRRGIPDLDIARSDRHRFSAALQAALFSA